MIALPNTPCVLVEDGAVGWHVSVVADENSSRHEMWFDNRDLAQAYARGLAAGGSYQTHDQSTDLPGWEKMTLQVNAVATAPAGSFENDEVRF